MSDAAWGKLHEHGEKIATLEANAATSQQERQRILETTEQVRDVVMRMSATMEHVSKRLDVGHERFNTLETKVDGQSRQLQDLGAVARAVQGEGSKPGLDSRVAALETAQTKQNAIVGALAVIGGGIVTAIYWVLSHVALPPTFK